MFLARVVGVKMLQWIQIAQCQQGRKRNGALIPLQLRADKFILNTLLVHSVG